MSFETFTKTNRRIFDPLASMWSSGQFGLNQATVDEYSLDGYTHVLLQFDRENKRIGLKFLDTGLVEGAVKITKRESGLIISARAFLDYYKINYGTPRRYGVTFDEEEKRLIFDLSVPL